MRRRYNGAKTCLRSHGIAIKLVIGRGALRVGRSRTERSGGRHGRENAGISSESQARNLTVENLRIPGEGSSAQGKSGPKPRTEVVGDGKLVEIPAPPKSVERCNDTEGYPKQVDGRACTNTEAVAQ